MKVYRIRRNTDGRFSTGGSSPDWTIRGKLWRGLGPLKCHLKLVPAGVYEDCTILEYELVLVESETGIKHSY